MGVLLFDNLTAKLARRPRGPRRRQLALQTGGGRKCRRIPARGRLFRAPRRRIRRRLTLGYDLQTGQVGAPMVAGLPRGRGGQDQQAAASHATDRHTAGAARRSAPHTRRQPARMGRLKRLPVVHQIPAH